MQCAEAECIATKLCELLAEVVDNTQAQVEKKQTRTIEELEVKFLRSMIYAEANLLHSQAEQEEEEAGLDDVPMEEEDSDDETPFYNPLNLPLGWDGKPIPYWLYKLHGLGVEYKCEICGNYSYWGRRAFDRHFQVGRVSAQQNIARLILHCDLGMAPRARNAMSQDPQHQALS